MTYVDIELEEEDIENESITIDIEDYLDEVDTDDLLEHLVKRRDLDTYIKNSIERSEMTCSKTPVRDTIIDILDLHTSATVEDIIEAVKEKYYK